MEQIADPYLRVCTYLREREIKYSRRYNNLKKVRPSQNSPKPSREAANKSFKTKLLLF